MKEPFTKAELLADIESRLDGVILSEKLIEEDINFNHYDVSVKITKKNIIAEIQSVQYFVFDEGTSSEEAYYRSEIPKSII